MSRPVLVTEIFAFAKRNCRTCHGRGAVTWNHLVQPCACAARRFIAEHRDDVDVDELGDVSWKDPGSFGGGLRQGLDLLLLLLQLLLRPLPLQKGPANSVNDPKAWN